MEKREYTVYKFKELSEKAQEKAIEKLSGINVDHDWYRFIYEDAETVGLKITGFDCERDCTGKLKESAADTADLIIKNHGEKSDTFKLAEKFLEERDRIVNDAPRDENGDYADEWALDRDLDALEAEFLKDLLEEYRVILSKEYDYLTSKAAIIETIEANDYDFLEDGALD